MLNALRAKKKFPKPVDVVSQWKIVKGDTVQLRVGKDRGKQGTVKLVLADQNKLVVEGVNLVKKHMKSTEHVKGGVFTKEAPVHYSNVALVDPVDGRATRAGLAYLESGEKVRIARGRRRSGAVIARPAALAERRDVERTGDKDALVDVALRHTWNRKIVPLPED